MVHGLFIPDDLMKASAYRFACWH